MTTILFLTTLIFVGYVIYEVFKTVWEDQSSQQPAPAGLISQDPPVATEVVAEPERTDETTLPAPTIETPKPAPKAEAKPATSPKPAATRAKPLSPEETTRGAMLRNPATGEVSPVPTNYRFAKKWIKEALVTEGLLDRVYKPNELDDLVAEKIKAALDQLRQVAGYKVEH